MQFKVASTLLAVVVSAIAAPSVDKVNIGRAAEVDGNLYVCTDANWAGLCANLGFYVGQCQNMPSSFNDNISSFTPTTSNWECTTYTDANCNGDTYSGHQPGFATLPSFINDHISSFRCEPV